MNIFMRALLASGLFVIALFAQVTVTPQADAGHHIAIAAMKKAAAQAVIDNYRYSSSNSLIKSIQNISIAVGSGATSNTATITSVGTANTTLELQGVTDSNTGTFSTDKDEVAITLTNATTVTATRTASNTFTVTAYIVVTEWQPSKIQSVQYGNATPGSASTTATATITSVTTTNATVIFNGFTAPASSSPQVVMPDVQLTNATTVTVHRDTANSVTPTVYFCVLEFKSGILNSSTQQAINSFTGTSATTTITSVTTGQAMLFWGGSTNTTSGASLGGNVKAVLTNGTTITFTKSTGTFTTEGVVTVVEFKAANINSVNRNTNVIATSSSSQASTITAINAAKTIVSQIGATTSNTAVPADLWTATVETNTTTITTSRISSSASTTDTASWEAIEFK